MNTITHLLEPSRLLLLWQAIDRARNRPSGDRFVVGEVCDDAGNFYLHYYDNDDTRRATQEFGFQGMTAFPYAPKKTYNGTVKEALSKRVASPERPDYADYLRSYRLPTDRKLSLLQLLAYTGGVLAGDGFSFSYTFDEAKPPFDFSFEIAGFRHNEGMAIQPIASLIGQPVALEEEPENPHDAKAVRVMLGDKKLGFLPKGMAEAVKKAILNHYVLWASVLRVNGTKDAPAVHVMVQVRAE